MSKTVDLRETFSFVDAFTEANAASSNPHLFKNVTIIKSGLGNRRDKHVYTAPALKEAVDGGLFENLSSYIDHPTSIEEQVQPERTVRDLAGVYLNPRYEGDGKSGRVVADLHVLKPHAWLAEGIRELVSMGLGSKVGISILGSGKISPVKFKLEESGEEIDAHRVDKFLALKSADIVTQAGAGGGFATLFESARGAASHQQQETTPMTVQDILKNIAEAATAGDTAKVLTLNASLAEAQAALAADGTKVKEQSGGEKTPGGDKVAEGEEKDGDEDKDEDDEKVVEGAVAKSGKRKDKGKKFGEKADMKDSPCSESAAVAESLRAENTTLRDQNVKLRAKLQASAVAAHIDKALEEADLPEKVETVLRPRLARLVDIKQIDEEIAYQSTLAESVRDSVLSGMDTVEGAGAKLSEGAGGSGASRSAKLTECVTAVGLKLKTKKAAK